MSKDIDIRLEKIPKELCFLGEEGLEDDGYDCGRKDVVRNNCQLKNQ